MKKKLKCQTCKNQVNGSICTMQKTMQEKSKVYKKCEGYSKHIPKPKEEEIIILAREEDYSGEFGDFLQRGGFYSFRTQKYAS